MIEERALVRQVAQMALEHGAADQALRLYQQLLQSPDLAKNLNPAAQRRTEDCSAAI